jgi:hypothetical protein
VPAPQARSRPPPGHGRGRRPGSSCRRRSGGARHDARSRAAAAGQVEHLAGLDPHDRRVDQRRAAPAAPVGHLPGHLVGLGDLGQVSAGGAGLLTGPAPRGPLIVLAACPRGLAQPVRGRRLGGVGGILAEPALQLSHPRLQRSDQAGLLGVDRAQLGDDRGLDRDGGFQIGDRGRDRGLHDDKQPSPLARGPYRTATPQPSDGQLVPSAGTVAGGLTSSVPAQPHHILATIRRGSALWS